jgi:hypothetical protein
LPRLEEKVSLERTDSKKEKQAELLEGESGSFSSKQTKKKKKKQSKKSKV